MSIIRESRQARSAFTFDFSQPDLEIDFSLDYERSSIADVLAEYPGDPQSGHTVFCGSADELRDNYFTNLPSVTDPDGHGKFLMIQQECRCGMPYDVLTVERIYREPDPPDPENDPPPREFRVVLDIHSAKQFAPRTTARVPETDAEGVAQTTVAIVDVAVIAAGGEETNAEQTVIVKPWARQVVGSSIVLQNEKIRLTISAGIASIQSVGVDGMNYDVRSMVPGEPWLDNLQITAEFDGLRIGFVGKWGKQQIGVLSEISNDIEVSVPAVEDYPRPAPTVRGTVEWEDNGYNVVPFAFAPDISTGDFAGSAVVNLDGPQYGGSPGVDFTVTIT